MAIDRHLSLSTAFAAANILACRDAIFFSAAYAAVDE